MPKHAKPTDDGPATVLESRSTEDDHYANCMCVIERAPGGAVVGRRDWRWECPVHGVDARVKAGLWPQKLADLWYKSRATQPIK